MYSHQILIPYVLLLLIKPTRKWAIYMWPWVVFACSYDCMRLLPNYEVNPIDIEGIYNTEKQLFGISTAAGLLTPSEFFQLHHSTLGDIIAGLSYICWVPLPLCFALYLYFTGRREWSLRFSGAFLFVNLVGFLGYYIHPAAPPWYVMEHGFEVIHGTGGSTAGLGRFDALVGFPVFGSIYVNNSNVFAAVPSLHSAYVMVATYYAYRSGRSWWLTAVFGLVCLGIWWTAVYSGHHYVIDVILGILTCIVALLVYEWAWRRLEAKKILKKCENF